MCMTEIELWHAEQHHKEVNYSGGGALSAESNVMSVAHLFLVPESQDYNLIRYFLVMVQSHIS